MARPQTIKNFRIGIQAQFILLSTVILTIVFVVLTYVLVVTNSGSLRASLVNETKAFASFATSPIGTTYSIYSDSGRAKISQQIDVLVSLDERIKNVTIVDDKGKPLFSQDDSLATTIPVSEAVSYSPTFVSNTQNNLEHVTYPFISSVGLHQYSIVYTVSSAHIDQTIQETVRSLMVLGLGGILFSAFLIFIFVNRVLLIPLRYLSQEAIAVSDGLFGRQISLKRRDEISDLGSAINHMAYTLQEDIRMLKETDKIKSEFLSIASHHLRTPLTAIDGYVSLLQMKDGNLSAEKVAEYIHNIAASTEKLRFLTNDMLTIANIEIGKGRGQIQLDYIEPLISKIIDEFKPIAQQKNVELQFQPGGIDAKVSYNVSQIHSVLEKILENSLEYTPANGIVSISLTTDTANVVIKIADTGSGMDGSVVALLFTKFHRGTDLLHYEHDGIGLGLYLAKLIIDQHHGSIDVASEKNVGTTVTITLPITSEVPQPK